MMHISCMLHRCVKSKHIQPHLSITIENPPLQFFVSVLSDVGQMISKEKLAVPFPWDAEGTVSPSVNSGRGLSLIVLMQLV
mmetsp:Transcript_12992/g.28667  ORF Transcript_12992/g.28667 Transcript_12992/m.28667 type:complete len:81 (+) Transcript_12992:208-450(+)